MAGARVEPAEDPIRRARLCYDHVAGQLSPHKRPRVVRYLDALPRNAMGKVLKKALNA